MELKKGLNERVLDAVTKAIKSLKPRPAVDRMIAYRLSKKYNSYAQYLLAYEPGRFGLCYVNLDDFANPKASVHPPEHKSARLASKKENARLKRQEERIERQEKALAKKKAQKEKKADKKTPKVMKSVIDPKATGWTSEELKRIEEIQQTKSMTRKNAIRAFRTEVKKAAKSKA